MVDMFYNTIRDIIRRYVPMANSSKNKYPLWYSKSLIKVLNEKNKYRKRYSKYKNPLDDMTYRLLKERSLKLIQINYKHYLESIESSLTSNPKIFWSFLKQKRNALSCYPSTMHYNSVTTSHKLEVSNFFASYFSSVYDYNIGNCTDGPLVESNNVLMPTVSDNPKSRNLNNIIFTNDMVEKALKGLDPCKGAGSDGIPPVFVNKCSKSLAEPLCMIFNRSLQTGHFPTLWKEALVVPIHKSGDKSAVDNYRPVSILSTFGKVFESLVYPIIFWHVKQLLLPQQHGFIRARSTSTNLATFLTDIVDAVDRGTPVDVIYTDFSKAFDKVNHQILINKLFSCGITGNLLSWCASYLVERLSKVAIDGFTSDAYMASSGVPQGSHLGPLFFNIFINDVDSCFLNSKIYLYADDLKVAMRQNNESDHRLLQEDLNRFSSWCESNKIKLNAEKCYFVHFSRRLTPNTNIYKIGDQVIQEVDVIRDLGVHIDSKLRFHVHIDKIAKKGFKLMGFVLRNCKQFKRSSSKIAVFNSLVRSGLEYGSVVWSPLYEIHKQRLESIQRKFLYHLSYQCKLAKRLPTYETRLEYFKLLSLEDRRKVLDFMFLYKIINNKVDCADLLSRINYNVPSKLARLSRYLPFKANTFRTNLGHFSAMDRIQSQFSKLSRSNDVDMSYSLRKFKSSLMSFKFERL